MIQTVLGPRDPASLGITLVHEHLTFTVGPRVVSDAEAAAWCERALRRFREAEGTTLVELTNIGMGRDATALAGFGARTGVSIIAGTGFYWGPFLPPEVATSPVHDLAARFLRDLTEGIDGTGIRAGVIGEIGTSEGMITTGEAKVFRAAARAHLATGAPIFTHTTGGTMLLEQLNLLQGEGVSADRVVLGHCDMGHPLEVLVEAAERGAVLGFDTAGKEAWRTYDNRILRRPDRARVDLIATLVACGFGDRLVLSTDVLPSRGEPGLNPETTGKLGYTYVSGPFAGMLRERGVSAAAIHQMLVETPRRVLTPAPKTGSEREGEA